MTSRDLKIEMDDFAVVSHARARGWLSEEQAMACLREDEKGRPIRAFLRNQRWLTDGQLAELDRLCRRQIEQEIDIIQGLVPRNRLIARRYKLEEPLGRGGSSRVYRALDLQMGRRVALKIVAADGSSRAERFSREVRIAARLRHPNIVQVYDVLEQEESSVIVMELIEGKTLTDLDVSTTESFRIIIDACRALEFAHQCGIIHRDLKPENLMVDAKGRVVVLDFGLAKDRVDPRLSLSGTILGTPAYMSPEQAQGKLSLIGERSDVYSLGATLYHLLTRMPPFSGKSALEVIHLVVQEDPVSPNRFNPSLGRDVCAIVLKAMSKEPERRYASVAELRDDLERLVRGDPIKAAPPSARYRLGRALRKHRAAAFGAAAAAVLLLCAVAFSALVNLLTSAEVEGLLKMAEAHQSAGAWKEALATYERAVTLAPEDSALKARTESLREDLNRRMRELSAQVELFLPVEHRLASLRKNAYRPDYRLTDSEMREYEALESEIEQKMRDLQPSAQGFFLMGRVRHLLSDRAAAHGFYDRGLELEPDHAGCRVFKAWLLMDEALIECFQPGEDVTGVNVLTAAREKAQEALALLDRAGTTRPLEVSELDWDLIHGYAQIVKRESGIKYATRMLEKWQGKELAEEFYLIRSFSQPLPQCLSDLDRAIGSLRSHAPSLFWRAVVRGGMKEFRAAIADLERVQQIHPCFVESYLNSAAIRMKLRDMEGAMRDMDRLISIRPETALAYLGRGNVWSSMNTFDRAMQDYDRAIELDPSLTYALCCRSRTRLNRGDLAGAWADAQAALKIDPKHAESYVARGLIHLRKNELDRAEEDFSRALAVAPRNLHAFHSRAEARLGLGRYEEAMLDCGRALELDPGNPRRLILRAQILARQNQIDAAFADYSAAIERDPSSVEAWARRALLGYAGLKQEPGTVPSEWSEAAQRISEALAHVPENSPFHSQLESVLEEIRGRLDREF